jgi:hypothetical protein
MTVTARTRFIGPILIGTILSGILATAALGVSYGLGGHWAGALVILSVGLIWLLAQWRGWDWMASGELVFTLGAAVFGLWLGLGTGWMLCAVVAAISAWDLDHFAQRLRSVGRVEGKQELERRHLRRLLVMDALGLLLAALATVLQFRLGFGAALLLGVLAVLGLSRLIGFLRRQHT